MRRITGLRSLGLGVMLTISVVSWGLAGGPSQAPVQPYTGQIREITIDQCGLQPGTCAGSMVLTQAGGQEVALAIQPETWMRRGNHVVHLEDVGIGNYVTVQATPRPHEPRRSFGFASRVGSSIGERPLTLEEANTP
jgi:hypothetical protein